MKDGTVLIDHVKSLKEVDLSDLFEESSTKEWGVTKYRMARALGGKNEPSNIDVVCLGCGKETKPISVRVPNHMIKDIDMYIQKSEVDGNKTYEDRSEFIKECIQVRLELEKTLLESMFRRRDPGRRVTEHELYSLIFSILKSGLGEHVHDIGSDLERITNNYKRPNFDIEISHPSGHFGIEIKSLGNR